MVKPVTRTDELSNLLGAWTDANGTLSDDLQYALAELIDSGLVAAGSTLPPQRALAAAIGISRGTVSEAYSALRERGYLVTRQGAGSVVRSNRANLHARAGGRLFSFTAVGPDVIDLSTGALPASDVAAEVISRFDPADVAPYLTTDGYRAGGLPALRRAIAEQLTRDGVGTREDEILVTAGAQQATWLAITALVGSGDLVLVEEPTYRGALEILRERGVRLRSIPLQKSHMQTELLESAVHARPALLYCQTGIHNPTGQTLDQESRAALARLINQYGVTTIEDRCTADLTLHGPFATGSLATHVDPDLLITIGSLSKLFWGGVRVGWIRASASRVSALSELLKSLQLGCSITDQILALGLIARTAEARSSRRIMLREGLTQTEQILHDHAGTWTWQPVTGGTGLWVDTGEDAVALVEHSKRAGVSLIAGPNFSAHNAQRTMIRLPIWHPADQLNAAMKRLAPFRSPPT